jgi:hypothetical protein
MFNSVLGRPSRSAATPAFRPGTENSEIRKPPALALRGLREPQLRGKRPRFAMGVRSAEGGGVRSALGRGADVAALAQSRNTHPGSRGRLSGSPRASRDAAPAVHGTAPRPAGRAGLDQIAKLAGVGIATVDRVLNERGNVSPVTARGRSFGRLRLFLRSGRAAGRVS